CQWERSVPAAVRELDLTLARPASCEPCERWVCPPVTQTTVQPASCWRPRSVAVSLRRRACPSGPPAEAPRGSKSKRAWRAEAFRSLHPPQPTLWCDHAAFSAHWQSLDNGDLRPQWHRPCRLSARLACNRHTTLRAGQSPLYSAPPKRPDAECG